MEFLEQNIHLVLSAALSSKFISKWYKINLVANEAYHVGVIGLLLFSTPSLSSSVGLDAWAVGYNDTPVKLCGAGHMGTSNAFTFYIYRSNYRCYIKSKINVEAQILFLSVG